MNDPHKEVFINRPQSVRTIEYHLYHGRVDFRDRKKRASFHVEKMLHRCEVIDDDTQSTVNAVAWRREQPLGDLFLDHQDTFREQIPVDQYEVEQRGGDLKRNVADERQALAIVIHKESSEVECKDIAVNDVDIFLASVFFLKGGCEITVLFDGEDRSGEFREDIRQYPAPRTDLYDWTPVRPIE